jgi:CubicO group peptidase (beta-lactamase class C family)
MQQVERLFLAQHSRGDFPGGQLVVQCGERRLLDLAVGTARGFRREEGDPVQVTPHTRFQVMSASKAVLARLVALLDERKLIDVTAPVRHYVPDFCAPDATVLDVLSHRSGVTLPELSKRPESWAEWRNVVAALSNEPAAYAHGTLAYQPIAFGWILTEILRRVTGETLEVFSAREVGPELLWKYQGEAASTYWLGARTYRFNGTDLAARFEEVNNHISARSALVPGAGMYTTARALAGFYASIVRHNTPVMARYTQPQVRGFDRVSGAYVVLGCGFSLGWRWPHPYGWWNTQSCFGHTGGFSVVAYADRVTNAGIAIVTNANRSVADLVRRFAPLGTEIRRALRRANGVS